MSSSNPKILLVGCLPESSKMDLFLNYVQCHREHNDEHRLGQQPALGIQLNTLPFLHKNRLIHLDIWNVTIPFERYRRLAPIYWNNVQAVVGVCSMANMQSFYRMKYWLNKFLEHCPLTTNIYILACENDTKATFLVQPNFDHRNILVPHSLIMDYGFQIQAKIFLIRRRCKGRDLSKFFDEFLNRFISYGRKQSKWKTMVRNSIRRICFCCCL